MVERRVLFQGALFLWALAGGGAFAGGLAEADRGWAVAAGGGMRSAGGGVDLLEGREDRRNRGRAEVEDEPGDARWIEPRRRQTAVILSGQPGSCPLHRFLLPSPTLERRTTTAGVTNRPRKTKANNSVCMMNTPWG